MIKASNLKNTGSPMVRLDNPDHDTINTWQDMIWYTICSTNDEKYGLPIIVGKDMVKSGGLFGKTEPCVIIYNENHENDYFQWVIILHEQRGQIMIDMWNYGNSRQFKNEMLGKNRGIGGAVRNAVFGSKDKWQEESKYYDMVISLICDALNIHM